MIQVDFDYTGKNSDGVWYIIDATAQHLGMLGGGGYNSREKHFTLYYEAHDCDCGAFPRKKLISPKMREMFITSLKQAQGIKNVKWKRVKL